MVEPEDADKQREILKYRSEVAKVLNEALSRSEAARWMNTTNRSLDGYTPNTAIALGWGIRVLGRAKQLVSMLEEQ